MQRGDTEVAPLTMTGGRREGSYGFGAGERLFTGLGWRHHYLLSRTEQRAGDVIPIPMANDASNCLVVVPALYGNGQTEGGQRAAYGPRHENSEQLESEYFKAYYTSQSPSSLRRQMSGWRASVRGWSLMKLEKWR